MLNTSEGQWEASYMEDTSQKQVQLLKSYEDTGDFEKLRDLSLRLLASNPKDGYILTRLVIAYYEFVYTHEEEFLEACKKAIKYADACDKACVFNYMALFYVYKGDLTEAENYHKEVLNLYPNNAFYVASYAETLGLMGKKEEYEQTIKRALKIDSENYYVWEKQFRVYRYGNFYNDQEAEKKFLEKMVSLAVEPFKTNVYLGDYHKNYNELDKAYDYYTKALMINPKSKCMDLEHKLIEVKREKEANILNQELDKELYPKTVEELRTLYTISERTSNYKKLDNYCRILMKGDIKSPGLLLIAAKAAYASKRYKSCIKICEEALKTKAKEHVYIYLGASYLNLHELENAHLYLKKGLDFDPRNRHSIVCYSYCMAKMGDLEQALAFIEGTIHFRLKDIYILDNWYRIIYEFANDFEREIAAIDKIKQREDVLKLKSQALLYKTITYEKYGKLDQALKYINRHTKMYTPCLICRGIKTRISTRLMFGNVKTGILNILGREKDNEGDSVKSNTKGEKPTLRTYLLPDREYIQIEYTEKP